jgi:hypothetical protein
MTIDLARQAKAVGHPWANAKYVLLASRLETSPTTRSKKERNAVKAKLGQAKTMDAALAAFDLDPMATHAVSTLLPGVVERMQRPQWEEAADAFHVPPAALPGTSAPAIGHGAV